MLLGRAPGTDEIGPRPGQLATHADPRFLHVRVDHGHGVVLATRRHS